MNTDLCAYLVKVDNDSMVITTPNPRFKPKAIIAFAETIIREWLEDQAQLEFVSADLKHHAGAVWGEVNCTHANFGIMVKEDGELKQMRPTPKKLAFQCTPIAIKHMN